MPNTNEVPEPWNSFLQDLESAVTTRTEMHCLGGFVVSIVYGFHRPTFDFDVLAITPQSSETNLLELGGKGSILERKHHVSLDRVGIASVPEDYEERLRLFVVSGLTNLRLRVLDPYDLALTKLERNSRKDREDVFHLARVVPFDLSILLQRYQREMRYQMGNPEREDRTLRLWIEAIEEERSREG